MSHEYNPKEIEKKWQDTWEKQGIYTTPESKDGAENMYLLSEFPYPSGNLHVGHWYAFAMPDIYARLKRMQGYNVLYPIGFDSFGLPAENAAIKRGLDPKEWTYGNIDYMRNQLKSMGASFDWSREIITSEPEFYRWTQWMFIQFFENDLVYRDITKVNWCEQCKTILANEQVIAGKCERCGSEVIQKDMAQWMLRITKFADPLIDDLEKLNWDESIKQAQREWIGRKEGSLIPFEIQKNENLEVFTTRADTLFGVTYIVLAPEHKKIQEWKEQITNWVEVENYVQSVAKKSERDRQQTKEKTGVRLEGITAINPATKKPIEVWIADYVLAGFGTGAVMAVPAHDERDAEFALTHDLPFQFVILPSAGEIGHSRPLVTSGENASILEAGAHEEKGQKQINAEWHAFYDIIEHDKDGLLPKGKRVACSFEGRLIHSGEFNGLSSEEARVKITKAVGGTITKTYRLRDWGVSRQRYWGTPIPIVYDPEGLPHSIPLEHLPWQLPTDVDYTPDGTAPLARSQELRERTENIFGKGWTPEVDTMDTFVDSSWYFYRYLDNKNQNIFAKEDFIKQWMPISMYFGGSEHTTMHLLYSRFWVKALHSLGLVPHSEAYEGRSNRGLILGPDGQKMSKSKGNVIDPDEVVSFVGADAVRMYLAFIGPFNEPGNYPWDPNGVVGVKRFLERVWRLREKVSKEPSEELFVKLLHQTIKKVSEDLERLKFNTAISQLMTLLNQAEKLEKIGEGEYKIFLRLLAPIAPHITEELWNSFEDTSIHQSSFPQYDERFLANDEKTLPIQINGKNRAFIKVKKGISEKEITDLVLTQDEVKKWISGKEIKKIIYKEDKIFNIVI